MATSKRDDRGIAMITAMMVLMVVTIVVAGAAGLAAHTAQRSGLDRNRSAALHAAEAGIEAEIAKLTDGSCRSTADVTDTALPDQNLPTESYRVLAPASCTAGGTADIVAVGYVPNATRPVATVTLVARMNRSMGAPLSGGTNGGYVFPDALFTDGTLNATSGAGLSVFGLGGAVPNLTANGAMTITDSPAGHLDGAIHGWSTVSLSGVQIGGPTVAQSVTLSGATVQGDVTASASLSLSPSTVVNGNARYGTTNSSSGATVTKTGPTQAATTLPQARPLPVFSDNQSEIGTALGVGTTPSATCPGNGTGTFYDFSQSGGATCSYNPGVASGNVVVIAHGGTLNVTVPQTSAGQLYVINDSGNVTVNGSNSTLPVFAYASGTLSLNGAFVGQGAGHAIVTTATATMTFKPPATTMPDLAFPGGFDAPTGTGYVTTLVYQYQCPGTTAC